MPTVMRTRLTFTRRTRVRSRAKRLLLSSTIVLFLFSSALYALDIAGFVLRTEAVLTKNLNLPLEERTGQGQKIIYLFNGVQDILYSFEVSHRSVGIFKCVHS